MAGRILFLVFGTGTMVIGFLTSLGDDAAKHLPQSQLAVLVGLGFMLGGVACGAAERREVINYSPPLRPGQAQPPAPQQWQQPYSQPPMQ